MLFTQQGVVPPLVSQASIMLCQIKAKLAAPAQLHVKCTLSLEHVKCTLSLEDSSLELSIHKQNVSCIGAFRQPAPAADE
jgi:hypothetical protein